ncbi:MAG: cobalt-factor II C(20)-methyltransferase [Methanomicrobiales archaeon]|jgi:precorrin-2/cobalt-factor-2 C20-methyltransferase|nr:cobalt-factor II C(20)-methyltransferase [Methanomicrobiales archaeon]
MLIGLGLGPGDPELLTLKAVRLLRDADSVFVPGRIAADLVAPYRKAEVLDFPMTEDRAVIASAMQANAERIGPFAMESTVVLGILGDPSFFSTFGRLRTVLKDAYPGIVVRTEPGVSSITAFASAAGVEVAGNLLVSTGRGPHNRLLLKVRHPKEAADGLRQEGFSRFVLVERMYLEGMRVISGDALPEDSDYMSILFAER